MAIASQSASRGCGGRLNWVRSIVILLLILCLLSCTAVRPVVKIGLVAPFEGLYRRTGYDALSAMRAAISESTVAQIDLLPLALDDSNDPARTQRALQKLLRDPQVRAVIGPLAPAAAAGLVDSVLSPSVLWLAPGVLTSAGFTSPPATAAALSEFIAGIAPLLHQQGVQRLALAGWPASPSLMATLKAPIPLAAVEQTAEVQARDAVLWLGDAVAGAAFLTQLRQVQPQVPFWLGLQGEDPVFAAFTPIRSQVYWASWANSGYDEWAKTHSPSTLTAYQVYLATQQAIARLADSTLEPQNPWVVRCFSLTSNGASQPLALP